jgi:thioredoxin 2
MAQPAESKIIACQKCGTKNRVASSVAGSRVPVCGKCGAELPATAAAPITVTDLNFASTVASSKQPVLVDFWASWCGPCRMIAPVIEQLALELAGRVMVGKLDIDANPQTAARFGVQCIPTLLILYFCREVDRIVGAQPKQAILQRLQRFI